MLVAGLLKFESMTNLPSPNAHFMHPAEYLWDGDDRLAATEYGSENGEASATPWWCGWREAGNSAGCIGIYPCTGRSFPEYP